MPAGPGESPTAAAPPAGDLSETVYAQLRAIAQHKLAQERPDHTLQATALVHEAFLRLDKAGLHPGDLGARFYGAAAEAMRRILIEHARAKKSLKRGGPARKIDWTTAVGGVADLTDMPDPEQFEALDNAITRLQAHDSRCGEVVRLRFYAGLTLDEVAQALTISPRSAKRDWEYARAWLLRQLGAAPPTP
jgi:RNA polymerase sigma factor (TIGR02999 family)